MIVNCLPSKINQEEVCAETEVLIGQLLHHQSKFKEDLFALMTNSNDLAHSCCGSQVD